MARSSIRYEVSEGSRQVSGLLGGVLLLCLALGLSGCATPETVGYERAQAETRMMDDIVLALNTAADQADALCGPGSAEAVAARAAVANVQSYLGPMQSARQWIQSLRSDRIGCAERIDTLQHQIDGWEDQIPHVEAEAARNAGGGFDDGPLGEHDHLVYWCNAVVGASTTNLSEGGTLHVRIAGSSVTTSAERTEADRLLAELASAKAAAAQGSSAALAAEVPGDNTNNLAVRIAYAAAEAAANRSSAAILRLRVLSAQIEQREQQQRTTQTDAELVTRQQEYDTAKSALDAAISAAEAAATAAEDRAESCAEEKGVPAPTWPRTPGWSSTFWDISS